MLELDDSQLSKDDREFLNAWAARLDVPESVLLGRILVSAIDGGGHYIESIPRYNFAPETPSS